MESHFWDNLWDSRPMWNIKYQSEISFRHLDIAHHCDKGSGPDVSIVNKLFSSRNQLLSISQAAAAVASQPLLTSTAFLKKRDFQR